MAGRMRSVPLLISRHEFSPRQWQIVIAKRLCVGPW